MTTTLLQWHDAAKESPENGSGDYLVVCKNHILLLQRIDGEEEWFDWGEPMDDVSFWAAVPTAEKVRQKFRDEKARKEEAL